MVFVSKNIIHCPLSLNRFCFIAILTQHNFTVEIQLKSNARLEKPMIRPFIVFLGLISFSFSANAQSTITLDSFDTDETPPKSAETNQIQLNSKTQNTNSMSSCLLNASNCTNKEFKSSASFSIDDVVNLGIVDRNEVKPTKVSTSDSSTPSVPQTLPSIDMEILFDYDSDIVRSDQYQKLIELSNVLKESKFNNYKFAFLGHSDSKGSPQYNRTLSFKRAAAVSQFLVDATGLQSGRMLSSGMGSSRLKTPGDPFGAANRRVQLVLIPVK